MSIVQNGRVGPGIQTRVCTGSGNCVAGSLWGMAGEFYILHCEISPPHPGFDPMGGAYERTPRET